MDIRFENQTSGILKNTTTKDERISFQFPDIPIGWHYIGRSKDFKTGIVSSVKLREREFVAFRTTKGELVVMHSHCPHMGANLTFGKICDDRLVCPFHAWEFGSSGKCERMPLSNEIPAYAKLHSYAVTERHGLAFMFYGKKPLYDLPFFEGMDEDDFFCDRVFNIHQDGEWYIVPSNAFDISHFMSVHKRIPTETPRIRNISPYARQITLKYRFDDDILSDKIMRTLYGTEAELSFTVWSGNLCFAVTSFGGGRFKNYMMIFIEPLPKGHSVSRLFVYSPGAKKGAIHRTLKWLPMRLRSIGSQKFFQREADMLKNVKFNSLTFQPTDAMLKEYLVWLNGFGPMQKPGGELV